MGTVRRTLALAAAAATLVLATACSDDEPTPKRADPTESTSSPTESDEQKPWEEQSNRGAVAFVKHWVDIFNQAQLSGETSELRRISSKDCTACDGVIRQIDDLYSSGGNIRTRGWKITKSGTPRGQSDGVANSSVVVSIDQPIQRVTEADGAIEKFGGSEETLVADLEWDDDAWSMSSLESAQG